MQALAEVKAEILQAAEQAKRNPNSIKLIAVSKGQGLEKIIDINHAGQSDFGENYVQEALEKIKALNNPNIKWHYLGKIQSNKIKDIVTYFDYIHSIDSLKHAEAIAKACQAQNKTMPVFVEINFESEASKGGFSKKQLQTDLAAMMKLPHLKVLGLMLIPSPKDNAAQREVFAQFRAYRDHLAKELACTLPELSMGMSDDFTAAILEGATYIRIGTRLFGPRQ